MEKIDQIVRTEKATLWINHDIDHIISLTNGSGAKIESRVSFKFWVQRYVPAFEKR